MKKHNFDKIFGMAAGWVAYKGMKHFTSWNLGFSNKGLVGKMSTEALCLTVGYSAQKKAEETAEVIRNKVVLILEEIEKNVQIVKVNEEGV